MNKRPKLTPPTPEEDAVITAAALSDPDNSPLTDEQLALFRPMRGRPRLALAMLFTRQNPVDKRI